MLFIEAKAKSSLNHCKIAVLLQGCLAYSRIRKRNVSQNLAINFGKISCMQNRYEEAPRSFHSSINAIKRITV